MIPLLNTLTINFVCRVRDKIIFRGFPGQTLRGAFGYCFRKICCDTGLAECEECQKKTKCAYSYAFETHVEKGKTRVSSERAPHPFIFDVSLIEKSCYLPDEKFEFGMVIIGSGLGLLGYFIEAVKCMGEHGLGANHARFDLEYVTGVSGQVLWEKKRGFQLSGLEPDKSLRADIPGPLKVMLVTPLRIISRGQNQLRLDFGELLRHSMRRASNLQYFYGDGDIEADWHGLLEKAGRVPKLYEDLFWFDQKRLSTRQKKLIPIGGILGEVIYGEGWQEFWPWLDIIRRVNLGKNCTFGMGKVVFRAPGASTQN